MSIKQTFYEDISKKNKSRSGVYHKTGKRVGKIRFPSDLMDAKEKREYHKSGEVTGYNMYEQVLHDKEFQKKSPIEQQQLLIEWRKRFKSQDILKKMGISEGKFYQYLRELDVPRDQKMGRKKKEDNRTFMEHAGILSGLSLNLKGDFTGKDLSDRLQKFALLLEGAEDEYQINLTITERRK